MALQRQGREVMRAYLLRARLGVAPRRRACGGGRMEAWEEHTNRDDVKECNRNKRNARGAIECRVRELSLGVGFIRHDAHKVVKHPPAEPVPQEVELPEDRHVLHLRRNHEEAEQHGAYVNEDVPRNWGLVDVVW